MLYNISLDLQHTDFKDKIQEGKVFARLKDVFSILKTHAAYEDKFILPAIAVKDSPLVEYFQQQHRQIDELIKKLFEPVTLFNYAVTDELREIAGEQLQQAFNQYLSFKLKHLCEEEEKLNASLWQYYSDEQISRIEQAIIATISREDMQVYIHWMINGISNHELISWFVSVKNDTSDAVFKCLLSQAEEQLSEERWEAIKNHLTEGVLLS